MSERATFDHDSFFSAIDKTRASESKTWRQVALEAGVSQSTLTRLAQGKRPDVDSLAALVSWARLNANDFVLAPDDPDAETPTVARIATFLRADKSLSPEAARALETVIEATYAAVGGGKKL
ncbi:helix-turn-helix transcriptional regulator [Aeromicrobium sp. CnD17-E]|uniref:helix-turn-helix domain-containing protein n=1 Tax=Aeromicrobium sp. CnD17-E TaxID=2954487 RepID=UPI002096FEBF|nr:helix-turn-helix transcriptional regulator [Aeromicrobium sp. CnD17-E]MCO7238194.1 helix-turn-helix transcriptional regulator [Aeromicrobium sp. CnD17-E]